MSYVPYVRRTFALTGAGGLLLLGPLACGGSHGGTLPPPSPYGSSPSAGATTSAPYGLSPLTGAPASGSANASRPAFGVAVSGPGMKGLGDADLVFEEESDPVRYIAVYQSGDSRRIGPLGQGRSTDPQLLGMLHGAVGYATIRPGPRSQFTEMGATDAGPSAHPSAYRTSGGATYTSTKAMYAALAKDGHRAPPTLFSYVTGGKPLAAKTRAATHLTVTVPGRGAQHWSYARGVWRRSGDGPHVTAANVVVQHTAYKETNVAHGGVKAPKAKVFGRGTCEVVSGPRTARGHWNRQAANALVLYVDSESFPFRFRPGRTWVVLAPPGTTVKAGS